VNLIIRDAVEVDLPAIIAITTLLDGKGPFWNRGLGFQLKQKATTR